MSQMEQYNVQVKIAEIINRSRHHEESFLVDTKTAASNIIKYLQKANIMLAETEERNQ